MSKELQKISGFRGDIAMAETIEDIKHLENIGAAMAELAKREHLSLQKQNELGYLRLELEQKKGAWLEKHYPWGINQHTRGATHGIAPKMPVSFKESARARKLLNAFNDSKESVLSIAKEIEDSGDVITPAKVVRLINKQEMQEKKQELKDNPLPLPDGKYRVIYADPPWEYNNSGFAMSAEQKYPTMPIEDICAMPVAEHTADNCVLFLWSTNPLLREAMDVIEAWGFEYKTNMVWIKKRHTAGFYVLGKHELILIAAKGSMLPDNKPVSVIEGDNSKHSKKPLQFYDIIESMYPRKGGEKYLELFQREAKEGWVGYGNEI